MWTLLSGNCWNTLKKQKIKYLTRSVWFEKTANAVLKHSTLGIPIPHRLPFCVFEVYLCLIFFICSFPLETKVFRTVYGIAGSEPDYRCPGGESRLLIFGIWSPHIIKRLKWIPGMTINLFRLISMSGMFCKHLPICWGFACMIIRPNNRPCSLLALLRAESNVLPVTKGRLEEFFCPCRSGCVCVCCYLTKHCLFPFKNSYNNCLTVPTAHLVSITGRIDLPSDWAQRRRAFSELPVRVTKAFLIKMHPWWMCNFISLLLCSELHLPRKKVSGTQKRVGIYDGNAEMQQRQPLVVLFKPKLWVGLCNSNH